MKRLAAQATRFDFFFFLQKPTMVFGSGGDTREVMDESDHWEQGP